MAFAFLASLGIACGNVEQPTLGGPRIAQRASALTSTGWTHVGPTGGVSQGNNPPNIPSFFTGTTTDVEGIGSRYRISTLGAGIFQWDGSQWNNLSYGLTPVNNPPLDGEGLAVNTFSTCPTNANTIVAGTAGENQHNAHHHLATVPSGIWKGVGPTFSWTRVASPSDVGDVFKIRWSDGSTAHAATQTGYWISRDTGSTWTKVLNRSSTDLIVKPGSPNTIYLASDGIGLEQIVWAQNMGQWSSTTTTIVSNPSAGRSVVAASQAPGQSAVEFYLAGIPNGGAQGFWKIDGNNIATKVVNCHDIGSADHCFPLDNSDTGQSDWDISLTANPTNPNQIMAWLNGAAQTQDGDTWRGPTGGSFHEDMHQMAWDTAGNLLAVGDGGYFYSSDGGQTFYSNSNKADIVNLVDFDVQNDGAVVVGMTWDDGGFVRNGASAPWTSIPAIGTADEMWSTADVGTSGQFWLTNSDTHCTHTTDFGATGTSCDVPGESVFTRVRTDMAPPVYIYTTAATAPGTFQLFRSTDFAGHWTAIGPVAPQDTQSMAVGYYIGSGGGGSNVYIQGATKIYTIFSGTPAAWIDITPPLGDSTLYPKVIAFPESFATATAVVMAFNPVRLFKTTNNGQSWTDITGDLPAITVPQDMVMDASNGALYLATNAGVYKSANNGVNWSRWTLNFPGAGSGDVRTLHILDDRSTGGKFMVYAGVWGLGIWQRDGTEAAP